MYFYLLHFDYNGKGFNARFPVRKKLSTRKWVYIIRLYACIHTKMIWTADLASKGNAVIHIIVNKSVFTERIISRGIQLMTLLFKFGFRLVFFLFCSLTSLLTGADLSCPVFVGIFFCLTTVFGKTMIFHVKLQCRLFVVVFLYRTRRQLRHKMKC